MGIVRNINKELNLLQKIVEESKLDFNLSIGYLLDLKYCEILHLKNDARLPYVCIREPMGTSPNDIPSPQSLGLQIIYLSWPHSTLSLDFEKNEIILNDGEYLKNYNNIYKKILNFTYEHRKWKLNNNGKES